MALIIFKKRKAYIALMLVLVSATIGMITLVGVAAVTASLAKKSAANICSYSAMKAASTALMDFRNDPTLLRYYQAGSNCSNGMAVVLGTGSCVTPGSQPISFKSLGNACFYSVQFTNYNIAATGTASIEATGWCNQGPCSGNGATMYKISLANQCMPTVCNGVACGQSDGCGGVCGCALGKTCSAGLRTCTP